MLIFTKQDKYMIHEVSEHDIAVCHPPLTSLLVTNVRETLNVSPVGHCLNRPTPATDTPHQIG